MALDFPSSPTNGQTFVSGNRTWTYNTTTSSWEASSIATSKTANYVYAAPNGSAGIPDFRALVAADLPNTAVTAGSYTYSSITVDAQGRITAASNGTAPVTSVTGTAPIVSSGGTTPAISISAATTSAAGSMSAADKTKLDGIATSANNYVLPKATASALGGVEVFDATVQTVAANAVTSTASRTYGVQLNAADQMVVNVPWVDTTNTGTVTSVGGTGTVSGLTLSGTVTSSGNLTLGGTLSLTSSNVTTGLGYTPPQPTGTGASGTWGISITGNAATVSNITRNNSGGVDINTLTTSGFYRINASEVNRPGDYGQLLTVYGGSDTIGQLYFEYNTGDTISRAGNPSNVGGSGSWSAWKRNLNTTNYTSYAMPSGSSATNSVDVRAPIFYDTNDTTYYVDPNSTSVMNAIQPWGEVGMRRGDSGTLLRSYNTSASQATQFYVNHNLAAVEIGNARGIVYAGGSYWQIANSARAPLFYDSDNTASYLDPAGTSSIGGEVRFGGGGNSSVITTDGDIYSRRASSTTTGVYYFADGGSKYLFWDGGQYLFGSAGPATSGTSFRAPVFYDNDNTGYYVNPNGTSNLSGLIVAGTISGNISGYSTYLPTRYDGGQITNPQTYFGQSIGLRVAMTGMPNVWSDTLWINGYSGGDVLSMCALHTSRAGTPKMWITTQQSTATSYGTFYEFPTLGYNSGNTNGLYAGIYYDSADTARYFNGNGGINFLTGSSNRVTIYSDDSGFYVSNAEGGGATVRTGAAYGLPGMYVNPNLYLQSEGGIYFHIANGQRGYFDSSSNLFANGSMRSPIFYDSNDTGYYVDPATGTSLAGKITQSGPGRTSTISPTDYDARFGSSDLWFWFKSIAGNGSSGYPGAIQFGRNDSVFSWPIVLNPRGGNVGVNSYSADYTLHVAGTGYASSDFRAPIYYDSNDTSYYTDPNGTSVLYNTQLINLRCKFDRSWENYPGIAVYNTTDQGPQGDFRIHGLPGSNGADFNVRLLVDGTIQSLQDARAPIFYDSEDTGYYTNPNGLSSMYSIKVWGNEITIRGGSPTLFFQDTDSNTAMLHNNSSLFYILRGGNDSTSWSTVGGYWPVYWNLTNNDATFGGAIWAAGNITAYSDAKLKDNVETVTGALDKALALRGVYYTLKRDENKIRKIGVIAQEVQEVLPEVVMLHQDKEDEEGTLSVDYGNMVGLLIEAIKEQQSHITKLEEKLNKLLGE